MSLLVVKLDGLVYIVANFIRFPVFTYLVLGLKLSIGKSVTTWDDLRESNVEAYITELHLKVPLGLSFY